eukprot:3769185-Rhodomonas_salina.1
MMLSFPTAVPGTNLAISRRYCRSAVPSERAESHLLPRAQCTAEEGGEEEEERGRAGEGESEGGGGGQDTGGVGGGADQATGGNGTSLPTALRVFPYHPTRFSLLSYACLSIVLRVSAYGPTRVSISSYACLPIVLRMPPLPCPISSYEPPSPSRTHIPSSSYSRPLSLYTECSTELGMLLPGFGGPGRVGEAGRGSDPGELAMRLRVSPTGEIGTGIHLMTALIHGGCCPLCAKGYAPRACVGSVWVLRRVVWRYQEVQGALGTSASSIEHNMRGRGYVPSSPADVTVAVGPSEDAWECEDGFTRYG